MFFEDNDFLKQYNLEVASIDIVSFISAINTRIQ